METFSADTRFSSSQPSRSGAWFPLVRPPPLRPLVRSWRTACDASDPPFIAPCPEPDCAHITFARNHAPQGGHTPLLYANSDPVYLSPPSTSSTAKSTVPLPEEEPCKLIPPLYYSTHLAGVLDSPPVMRREDLASQKPLTPPPTMPHPTLTLPEADVEAFDGLEVDEMDEECDIDASYPSSSFSPHPIRFDLPLSPLSPSWDPPCTRALSIASPHDFADSEHLNALFSPCDATSPPALDYRGPSPLSPRTGSLLDVDVDVDAPRPLLAPISIPWTSSPTESDPEPPSPSTSGSSLSSLIDYDELLPPSSPLISRLDLPDLEDDGLPKIVPSSPSRRSFSGLPDSDTEMDDATSDSVALPGQSLLSLPGAETDDDLIPRIPPAPSIPLTRSEPLLFIDDPQDVPLPRSPSPEDFHICIPPEEITDPELAGLCDLRKRSLTAELDAWRVEKKEDGVDLFTRAEARKRRKRERERSKEVGALLRLKLNDHEVVRPQAQVPSPSPDYDPQAQVRRRGVIGNMAQLVAQMVFRRHETARPLAKRKTPSVPREYVRSALSDGVTADDGA